MWKAYFGFLIMLPAYGQVFTEDISKIAHAIAERELDAHSQNPSKPFAAEYLRSLVAKRYYDPSTNCEENPDRYRPKNYRYEVMLISEDRPRHEESSPAEVTVAVARYDHSEGLISEAVKNLILSQTQTPGILNLKHKTDKGTQVIHFANPETSISLHSKFKAQNALELDLTKIRRPIASDLMLELDLQNSLDIKHTLDETTAAKATLEATYSSGPTNLQSLDNMKLQLSGVKAESKIDHRLRRNIDSYTSINFQGNNYDQTIHAVAGLSIRLPANAELLVFTGYRANDKSNGNKDEKNISRELGVELKKINGVKIYGRLKDRGEGIDRSIETGIEVPLNK